MTSSRPTLAKRRPGPRPRRGRPAGPADVRRAVLDAAADLFARHRVDNVSLRQIAEAAGVQLSLIDRYVGCREDLIVAVLDELSRAVTADVLARPTEQISFERDSAMGRWTRVLAYRALAGEHAAGDVVLNPVRAIAEVSEHEYGLDPASARIRGAQVVASALGWRLFEDFLVEAGGLGDEPREALRDELTRSAPSHGRHACPVGRRPATTGRRPTRPCEIGACRRAEAERGEEPVMSTGAHQVSTRQRVAAVVSLACGLLLATIVLVFVFRNAHHLIVALIGLAVTVAGGWWMVATRGPKRFFGVAGVVVGVGIVIGVGIQAGSSADSPLVRIGLAVGLAAITFATARSALVGDVAELERHARADAPTHPVLICNPWSGGGKVERFGLVELAHGLGVETVMLDHGLDLEQLARDAIARGADCLGMAGGDGSQALVASIAVEHDLPFVCVSAGTRNHFALDLGIDRDDPRGSLQGFRDAVERRIDYATVNGRFFVNNASLGAYATIVQQEGYRDAKVETSRTLLPDLLGQTDQPFDLQFTEPDGTEVDGAFVIQVSNNPYVLGPSRDVSQRRRLDTGQLGVFAITAKTGAEAASVVTLSLVGQRKQSKNWHEFTTATFEVRSRSGKAYIGVDGEALEMDTPLRFEIYPRGLRLHVPSGNLAVASRRRARDVDLRDLVTVARGRAPASTPTGGAVP